MAQYSARSEIWTNWSVSKISLGMVFASIGYEFVWYSVFICCGGTLHRPSPFLAQAVFLKKHCFQHSAVIRLQIEDFS